MANDNGKIPDSAMKIGGPAVAGAGLGALLGGPVGVLVGTIIGTITGIIINGKTGK